MELNFTKKISNGAFAVTLTVSDLSPGETKLRDQFGDPIVEAGGTFGTAPGPVFTLPSRGVKLSTGFKGLEQSFDSSVYADAEQRGNVWLAEMVSRLRTAASELRANGDSFTGTGIESL